MPDLTHLTIDCCKKLKMLSEGLQHVTTLRELKLIEMPREFNDEVRSEVRHIPTVIFEKQIPCKSLPLSLSLSPPFPLLFLSLKILLME